MRTDYDRKKEVGEAIAAGENVLVEADAVLSHLDSAKRWGVMDLFLHGGFLSTMAKYSRMENAQRAMERLRMHLRRFNEELTDVQVYDEVGDIEIDGFTRFADFFFDNPFTDFLAVTRIEEVRNRVAEMKEEVIQTLDILYREEGLL